MRNTRNGNWMAVFAACAAVVAARQDAKAYTIYDNVFPGSGGTLLNGTAPGFANNDNGEIGAGAAWSAGVLATDFKANGTVANNQSPYRTAYLPFVPAAGKVYELSSTVNVTTNNQNWIGVGFSKTSPIITNTATANRMSDANGSQGYAWMLHRGSTTGAANADQAFAGPNTTNPVTNAAVLAPGLLNRVPADLLTVLDTTQPQWAATLYVRQANVAGPWSLIGSFTYAATPDIHYVAMNAGPVSGTVSNLKLRTNAAFFNVDADSDWETGASWLQGVSPNGADAEADLLNVTTASRTITVNNPVTLGGLTLRNANPYLWAGAGSFTMQAAGSSGANFDVQGGAQVMTLPVILGSNTTFTIAAGASLNPAAGLSGTGTLSKVGGGTLVLSAANTYAGGTKLNGGLVQFAAADNFGPNAAIEFNGGGVRYAAGNTLDLSTARSLTFTGPATVDTNGNDVTFASATAGTGALTKAGAGTLTLGVVGTYAGITVTGGKLKLTGSGTTSVSAVSVAATGDATLDIGARTLEVNYAPGGSPVAAVAARIAAAYDHGKWDLPGVTSSAIGADSGTALGYIDDAGNNRLTVRRTWYGDLNLDGVVNSADVALVGTATGWGGGDVNYDGAVTADDYALMSLGAGLQTGTFPAAVPEPAAAALVAVSVTMVVSARRRRR